MKTKKKEEIFIIVHWIVVQPVARYSGSEWLFMCQNQNKQMYTGQRKSWNRQKKEAIFLSCSWKSSGKTLLRSYCLFHESLRMNKAKQHSRSLLLIFSFVIFLVVCCKTWILHVLQQKSSCVCVTFTPLSFQSAQQQHFFFTIYLLQILIRTHHVYNNVNETMIT